MPAKSHSLRSIVVTLTLVSTAIALTGCGSDAPAPSKPGGSDTTTAASCGAVGDDVTATSTQPAGIDGVVQYVGMSRNHVEGCVNYPQTPPVGGNHSSIWQGCNFYSGTIIKEQAVHSMEHGAVWIVYRSDISEGDLNVLKAYSSNDKVLVSRWDSTLRAPVIATAWGLQVDLTSTSDPRLDQFVQKYADGPQNPEPGVPCRDGGSMQE